MKRVSSISPTHHWYYLYLDQELYFRLLPVYEAHHSIGNVRSTHHCLLYILAFLFRLLE